MRENQGEEAQETEGDQEKQTVEQQLEGVGTTGLRRRKNVALLHRWFE